MSTRIESERLRAIPFPRVFDTHRLLVGLAYLAAYVGLDRVKPYAPFGITPWNPNTGLSFALVLAFGLRMIPLLFVGPFLADLVNGHFVS